MNNWDFKFLGLAEYIGSTWSKDPVIKVGAVLANPENPREYYSGYNGFPRGVVDYPSRYENKTIKHSLIVHAEINAILNAQRDLRDFTLYTTRFPCIRCLVAVIQSGITRIVTPIPNPTDIWKHKSEYLTILITMKESGMVVLLRDGDESYDMPDLVESVEGSGERT